MCYELWRQQRKSTDDAERARREADAAIEKAKQAKPVPARERRTDQREPATSQ